MALTPDKTKTLPSKIEKRVDSFSASSSGRYNIKSRCYPMEVSTDVDRLHYVTFFINVRGKSKVFAKNKPSASAEMTSIGENRLDMRNMGKAIGIYAGGMTGMVKGLAIGRTVSSAVYTKAVAGGGKVISSAIKGVAAGGLTAIGGAAIGAGAGAVLGDLVVQPDTTYRIADAVTLHLQHAPQTSYSAKYDTTEVGALVGAIAGGQSITDAAKGQMALEGLRALVLKGAKIPGSLTGPDKKADAQMTADAQKAIEAASGQTLNPHQEVLFKQIGFRKFQFDYRFFPKSAAESANVFEIIKTFKYHMHPEISQGGVYYIHPSTFNIQYFFNGKENKYFNKISTCVLEDVSVDYGGDVFSSFRDGAPVEIGLRLVFQEIETLTKERIEEGF